MSVYECESGVFDDAGRVISECDQQATWSYAYRDGDGDPMREYLCDEHHHEPEAWIASICRDVTGAHDIEVCELRDGEWWGVA